MTNAIVKATSQSLATRGDLPIWYRFHKGRTCGGRAVTWQCPYFPLAQKGPISMPTQHPDCKKNKLILCDHKYAKTSSLYHDEILSYHSKSMPMKILAPFLSVFPEIRRGRVRADSLM
jgi:hypothetical protein